MKKRIILLVCGIVACLGILFSFQLKNKNNLQENNVKNKNGSLAIMIKENGATEYIKSSSNSIPIGDYVLNEEKSYCKNNGKIGDYDSSLGKVSFSFIGTDKCYLYFDYKESKELYKLIANRYNRNDGYVKLYNEEDASTYANPVYYFNEAVENNNVLFGGFCWQIVRTTETGGVKIVYNGKQKDISEDYTLLSESEYTNLNNDASYPYTFDSANKTWTSTNTGRKNNSTITFTAPSNGHYVLNYDSSLPDSEDRIYVEIFKNDVSQSKFSGTTTGQILFKDLSVEDTIKVAFTRNAVGSGERDNVIFNFGKVNSIIKTCNNIGTDSQLENTKSFNYLEDSPAYVGYMYNTIYSISSRSMSSLLNIVFGNTFTYSNGTYTLSDTMTVVTKWSDGYDTINNNHYTCFTTGTTCTELYYVYYTDWNYAYYIMLKNGKSVDDALNEMLYADDVNKTDSVIKKYIDNWYENNLLDYENKLEDTVFCNDRSISNLNGWNPNGGSTASSYLYFKSNDSVNSLVCTNETDRFSTNNAKAHLKYPIGLLSAAEVRLANSGSSRYFAGSTWLCSPYAFSSIRNGAYVYTGSQYGVGGYYVNGGSGVRPSVSLKPKIEPVSGDGSYTNPYVVS